LALKLKIILRLLLIFISLNFLYCNRGDLDSTPVSEENPNTDNYNFKNGGWNSKAPMNVARLYPAGAIYKTKFYVFNGLDSNNNPLNSFEIYDSQNDSWVLKSPMPFSIFQHRAETVNDKIFLIGGSSRNNLEFLKNLYMYEPEIDRWTKKSDMIFGRTAFGSAVVNGKIYVLGGIGENPDKILEYNPLTDEWKTRNSTFLTPRYHFGCTALNGLIYILNGESSQNISDAFEIYNPVTDELLSKTKLTVSRHSCIAIGVANRIYVIGGAGTDGFYRLNLNYDIGQETWTKRTPMLTDRYGSTGGFLNGNIFIIGGSNNLDNKPMATNEMYNP
jgi:N-acetylneuraminic acid mutarotase